MSFLSRLTDLFRPRTSGGSAPPHPGYGNGAGIGTGIGWFGRLPGTQVNWIEEAGPLELNSVVYACIHWKSEQALEAPLRMQRRMGDEWANAPDNDMVRLLTNPNPQYGFAELLMAMVASMDITGNFYALKLRDGAGRVAELWWIPSHMIGPEWDATQRDWTQYYRYTTGGGTFRIDPRDVVHLRAPLLNRNNPRLGQAPLEAVLRDVAGDNGASSLLANIYSRNGMPSHLVMPDKSVSQFTADQASELSYQLNLQFAGDDRGKLAVVNMAAVATALEFKPDDLGVDKARYSFEERICAVLQVPPVVVGMGTGLAKSTAKASYADSRRAAYQGGVIPMQRRIASQLYRQLAPDMVRSPGLFRLHFDTSGVDALQEDEGQRVERLVKASGGPYMTVNEARARDGLPPIEGGDALRSAAQVDAEAAEAQTEESDGEEQSN